MANGNGYNPQVAPTVLGSGTQPLNYLLQRRQREGLEAQRKQALAQKQQAARNDQIGKLMQYQPDKAWEPYDQAVKDRTNEYRNWVVNTIRENPNAMSDPRFMAEQKRRQDDIGSMVNQSQFLKNAHQTQWDAIKDDKYLNKEYYQDKLNNMIFGEGGRIGRGFDEIDYDAINNITQDAKGYNMDVIGKEFVDQLPDQIQKYYTEKENSLGGRFYDITEKKGKALRSAEINPKTQTYDINVTDDVVLMAKEHPYLSRALDQYKQETGETDDKKALGQILDKYTPQPEIKKSVGREIREDATVRKDRQVRERADRRYQLVRDAVYNGDFSALVEAADLLDLVDIRYGAAIKDGKPTHILVDYPKFDVNGVPIIKTKEIRIISDEDKRNAMGTVNKLIDDAQPGQAQTIGSDEFRQAGTRWQQANADLFDF